MINDGRHLRSCAFRNMGKCKPPTDQIGIGNYPMPYDMERNVDGVAFWLMKSEPEELAIDHLAAAPRKPFRWDGVHNYRARNWMMAMEPGDRFFFAHSSCKVPGIAGVAEIIGAAYTDPTQFEPESHYYDADSKPEKPRWISRDVRFVERFPQVLSLQTLRTHTESLGHFHLLQKANRLSVMPVGADQWTYILALARASSTDAP